MIGNRYRRRSSSAPRDDDYFGRQDDWPVCLPSDKLRMIGKEEVVMVNILKEVQLVLFFTVKVVVC